MFSHTGLQEPGVAECVFGAYSKKFKEETAMTYKLTGDVWFDTAIKENQTPEETVAEFISNLQSNNQTIQATGKVSRVYGNGNFEFVVSVVASVDYEGDDEDEILENLEAYFIDCDDESSMTIFDVDFDYSYSGAFDFDEEDDFEDEDE